jgi:hypothetical protein
MCSLRFPFFAFPFPVLVRRSFSEGGSPLRCANNAHVLVGIASAQFVPQAFCGLVKSVRADLAKPVLLGEMLDRYDCVRHYQRVPFF